MSFCIDIELNLAYVSIIFCSPIPGFASMLLRYNCTSIPVNAKHLYNICTVLGQRRRRWADAAQMLYKCFLFSVCWDVGMYTIIILMYANNTIYSEKIQYRQIIFIGNYKKKCRRI